MHLEPGDSEVKFHNPILQRMHVGDKLKVKEGPPLADVPYHSESNVVTSMPTHAQFVDRRADLERLHGALSPVDTHQVSFVFVCTFLLR